MLMSGPWCAAMRRMRTGQAIVRTEGTSCVRERRRVRLSSLLCLSDSPAERRTAVYSCRPVGDVRKKTDARPSHQRSRHREGRVEPRGRAHDTGPDPRLTLPFRIGGTTGRRDPHSLYPDPTLTLQLVIKGAFGYTTILLLNCNTVTRTHHAAPVQLYPNP